MRNALDQLLLPAECLQCRALLSFRDSQRLVCDVCRHRWRPVRAPWCGRCGQPEPLFGRCRLCADWPAALILARSAVWLDAAARDAVHALKYRGLPRIAADLASAVASLDLPGREAAWLVPVPLGAGRLRQRGYNQSERLARALSRRWNRPVVELLVRTRDTGTQTALTPEARLANVAGAFETRNAKGGTRNGRADERSAFRVPSSAFERPLVLVDDVFTTGATLAEAARALERAGARTVLAVTFGRALVPDFT
ncbi:MAG TPA: double zinc ribbon domain-containing protein [Gemmatimonadales bacterium]|nr:double zinc ribbon domain-containing protein [Gemmatimonadales bacterium]